MSKALVWKGQLTTVFSEVGAWAVDEVKHVSDDLAVVLLRHPDVQEVLKVAKKVVGKTATLKVDESASTVTPASDAAVQDTDK